MSENHLSLEERIIERLRKPGTLGEIAQKFKVPHHCVYYIEYQALRDGRLDEKYRRLCGIGITREQKEEAERAIIKRLRKPGSLEEIGKEFGYKSGVVIGRIMNRAIENGMLSEKYRRNHGSGATTEELENLEREVIKRLHQGQRYVNISRELGCSEKKMNSIVRKAKERGILLDKYTKVGRITERNNIIIERARSTTQSISEIARCTKICGQVVNEIINKAIEKGELEPRYKRLQIGCGLVQWQYDDVIKKIQEQQEKSNDVNYPALKGLSV